MLTKFKSSFSAFVRNETSGATLLLAATIVALLWANLGGHSYEHFWHTHFSIHLGDIFSVDMSLQHWINDGLMMMFFFLVSLEVKHDFVMGELREWRRASVPVVAAGSAAVIGILRSVSINERMQLALAPIVNLIVVPVFALSNAGVIISGETLQHAFKSPLTWGIIAGLVGGKYLGVFGASIIATKLRIGELAQCLAYRHINAGSMLTGIGFTISLFIIDLAIKDETAQSDARIGVLTASILAAIIGMVALVLTAAYDARHAPERTRLNRSIDPKRDHILGDPNAPLTLVEYAQLGGVDDITVEEVVREVRDYFGDDLRFVFRHNPMGDEAAERAAEALEAVHAQSPELFNYARTELSRLCEEEELDSRVIRRAAVDVGSNLPRLEKDMRQRTYLSRVHDDADDALGMGLTSTPTFFIGDEIYEGPIESNAIIAALEATRTAEITTVGV